MPRRTRPGVPHARSQHPFGGRATNPLENFTVPLFLKKEIRVAERSDEGKRDSEFQTSELPF